ncbi:MAG: rhodanese family protein [Neisseriaceae bacterium]|nr:rhodanese family protein [Neisseriaceae bacterium]
MTVQTINPQQAAQLVNNGAIIIDIRSNDEYGRKHISGAKCIPVSELAADKLPNHAAVIFTCLSGLRTQTNAQNLAQCACNCNEVYLLDGGLKAWENHGLPVESNGKATLDIMRQVQIGAGSLILIGVLLGFFVHQGFFLLSGFVGAGLLFAGLTGFCGLAVLLAKMPWNKA